VPLNAVELQAALAGARPGLRVDSLSGTSAGRYLQWIGPCLYYFDVNLDQRIGEPDYTPGRIMLVPICAPEPMVFQRHSQYDGGYTRSVTAFYAVPPE
jgi:hypothetical protein